MAATPPTYLGCSPTCSMHTEPHTAVPKTVGSGTGLRPVDAVVFPHDMPSRKYVPIVTVRKHPAVVLMVH